MRQYRVVLLLFARWLEARGFTLSGASGPEDVNAWLAERRDRCKPATIQFGICALRSFYGWLQTSGRRPDNPAAHLRHRTIRHKPHRPYDREELEALLATTRGDVKRGVRDRAILLLFISSGLRLSEVAGIAEGDIDWRRGTIRVKGKGEKERVVAPEPNVMQALRAYMRTRAPTVWGIDAPAIETMVRRRAKQAGLSGIHPHGFRHTLAIRFLERSRDLDGLRIILGHETLKQAAEYAAYGAEQRALEQQRRLGITDGL